MSIGVRVSVSILALCVAVSVAFAVLTYMQKQTLQGQNQMLHGQISSDQSSLADLTTKVKKLQDDADQLNNKISQAQQEKAQVQSQFDDLKHRSDDLQAQIQQANADRDDWKNREATIQRERDDLVQKLKNRPTKIVYRDHIVQASEATAMATATMPAVDVTSTQGDQYWANVLKQKAALQVEVQKEKYDLDQAALQVVDLKKQNSDLELEIKSVTNEKDEIVQKIKYGQDVADNLSIDLARSRNDQKMVNDRADRLKEQNMDLLNQIRDLSSTKVELEKTISRLTDDRDNMQKKLIETQSVIQSRIDDIWKIKEGLDKKLSENAPTPTSSGSMDLPPIIVNAPNNQQPTASDSGVNVQAPAGKVQGNIISINESNNFVIVDFGSDNSSVAIGNSLKVYRNSNNIASLQVIQVRRDICAADIKDKSGDLKVGDVVKFN